MIRQFKIVNGNGESINLNEAKNFLQSPTGLGFEEGTSYHRNGSLYTVDEDFINQQTIAGTLVFAQPNAYENYHDFVRFSQIGPLKLEYTTPAGTFYRDVRLKSIEKTELENFNLQCPLSFECESLWYKIVRYNLQNSIDDPYLHQDAKKVTISNSSQIASPTRIVFDSFFESFKWQFYESTQNSIKIINGAMEIFDNGFGLVVDNTKSKFVIDEIDNADDSVIDAYDKSDFKTPRFVTVAPSATTTEQIFYAFVDKESPDFEIENNWLLSHDVYLEVHEQYVSV